MEQCRIKWLSPVKVLTIISILLLITVICLVAKLSISRNTMATMDRHVRKRDMEQMEPSKATAAVYTRWGREDCSGDAQLVYGGVVGGGLYNEEGNGANYLCLPHDPILGPSVGTDTSNAHVYGAEYQSLDNLYGQTLQDHDIPCAVCKITRGAVIMLPARNVCYPGWTTEYKGFLVAQYYGHLSKTEYVCLDENPHKDESGLKNENGVLMFKAIAKCGTLPCPNYEDNRVLTCAVCSQ